MKAHLFLIFTLLSLTGFLSAQDNKASVQLAAAIYEEEVTGNLDKASGLLQDILIKYPDNRPVAAKALYHLGLVTEKTGKQKAGEYFKQLVKTYPDQTEVVALAKARLAALGGSGATVLPDVVMHRILKTDNGYNPIAGISQDSRTVILNKNGDLWLHNLQSGEQKQITHEASRVKWSFAYGNASAFISPDGKWIVHTWSNGPYGELRLSSIDGSSMRVLHNGRDEKGRMVPSGWMPDGKRILASSYNMKDYTHQLYYVTPADSAFQKIGQPFREESTLWVLARPSPDGRYIAYSREDDIYIFDTATEQESVFVQNPAKDALTGWIPDGSGIVFLSNRSGTYDLYLQGFGNGKPSGEVKLLRRDFGANSGFSITQNGKLFRIEQTSSGDSFIVPVDKQTGKPTGVPTQADPNYTGVEGPRWSSDGKLFYYEVYRNMNNEQLLFVRSEETGQTHEIILKPKLKFWYRPILSPDGHQFIITGTSDDANLGFGLFTVDPESGDVSQLVKITESASGVLVDPTPSWSPDSKAIYYKLRSPEKSNEFIIRCKYLTSGEEKDIHRGFQSRGMNFSPDGTRFVYYRSEISTKSIILSVFNLKSGKELELWRGSESNAPGLCNWTPDGKYILVDKDPGKGTELWRLPSADGPGEKLHFFPEGGSGFVLHPNGDRMAFTQPKVNWELWVLENFLPK